MKNLYDDGERKEQSMACKIFDETQGGASYYPVFEDRLMVQPLRVDGDKRELLLCRCGDCGQLFVSESIHLKNKEGKPWRLESYIAVASEVEAKEVVKTYPSFMKAIRTLQRSSFFVHNHTHIGVNRLGTNQSNYLLKVEAIQKGHYASLPSLDIFTLAQRDGINVLDHYPGMALWVFNDDQFIQDYANENITRVSAAHMILHLLDLFVDDDLRNQIDHDNLDEWIDYISQFAHGLMLRKESDRFTVYAKRIPLHERIMMTIKP